MLIDNVDDFSTWLVNELKELCEANPTTLSKYVIALLKKDKSESSLRKICIDQLYVFLVEKTNDFVDKVFECLKSKAYEANSKTNDLIHSNSYENDIPKFVETINNNVDDKLIPNKSDDLNVEDMSESKRHGKWNKSRSDSEEDKKDIDHKSHSKRPLDYHDHKSYDDARKKRRYNDDDDLRDRRRHSSRHRSHKSKRHVLDRLDHGHKHRERSDEYRPKDIKTSCPDFVEKGFCLKGDSCEYDHGAIVVRSDISCIYSAPEMNQNVATPNWPHVSMNQTWVDNYGIPKQNSNLVNLKKVDDSRYDCDSRQNIKSRNIQNTDIYDPSHPEIDAINDTDSRNGLNDQVPVYVPSKVEAAHNIGSWPSENDEACSNNYSEGSQVTTVIGSVQSRFRRTISPNRRGRYNNGNNNNNFNKRTANARCLLVTHIPYDCNDEAKLKQHFRAFGSVTDVEVRFQNDSQHALIEFETADQARAAFRSPLPILENRFIRTSLFTRPNDSQNLRVCKDVDDTRDRRKVVQNVTIATDKDKEASEDMMVDKWPSDDERSVVVNDEPKPVEKKTAVDRWPVASELKLDRRITSVGDSVNKNTASGQENVAKTIVCPNAEKNPRLLEAQIERQKKLKALNDKKELKSRIERLEESVQSCKNRLRGLLEEQKNEDCDKDLVKRQLLESYNYLKELRDMLESLKKKLGPQPQMTEIDKLKVKIKNTITQLADLEKDSDAYKKHLKMITEYKRDLVKLQTITKGSKPNRLPSLYETKLDNRPKTLYVTGMYSHSTIGDVKNQFKNYQIEKIKLSDSDDVSFFVVEFKTRKEADRVVFEMSKKFKEKNISLSFDKPIQICDPLDFKTRGDHTNTQRGTPRDNCASSDEEDESKPN